MGSDLALVFSVAPVFPEREEMAWPEPTYMLRGVAKTSGGVCQFFGLWSGGQVDLLELCRKLSLSVSPLCVSWRSDHGGVAGFVALRGGDVVDQEDANDATGEELPLIGVERTLDVKLEISEEDRSLFPDIVIAEGTECLQLGSNGRHTPQQPWKVTRVLEGDEPVEPVLPMPV